MARDRLQEFLQVGTFHLFDVSLSLPLVLIPIFGFHKVSAPGIRLDIHKIKEGNFEYPRKIVKSAEVHNVTLEQGVSIFNSDFGDWATKAVTGRVDPKNLLLIHFSNIGFGDGDEFAIDAGPFSFEFVKRVPARGWLLKQCIPSDYKAASDFDAMSQQVSVASLELEIEEMDEITLGI